jgi:hypothetical protein
VNAPIDPDDYPEHTVRSLAPESKVVAGAVAGAVSIILVWLAGLFGLEVPPEVAAAVTVVLGAGTAYLKRSPT